MCIIVAKEKGKKLPSKDILKQCFDNNSDGAGLMYVHDNKVIIDKGYMTFKSFYKRLQKLQKRFNSDLTDKAIVMHFRIGTSGENDKATTHPFPISSNSEDLKKIYFRTDLGMVHNGIISNYVYGKDLSDTQNFVKDFVSVLKELDDNFLLNERVIDLLDKECKSKLCFLDNKENIYYIGDFIEDNGIKYSNSTYKEIKYSYTNYNDYNTSFIPYKNNIITYKNDVETLNDFIEKNIDYEVLETGDMYELEDGTVETVREKDCMFIDEYFNLWQIVDYRVSLIGSDVIVYDNNYTLKYFHWEYDY